jgi:heptosyltransferase-2
VKGKILVIRGGAIGDFILTLPAIAALRSRFPDAHLEVLGYPHITQLALAGGLVDRIQSIEARGLAGFFARNGELSEDLTDYFSEFDLIISYLYDPDEIFHTNVQRCTFGQFIAGPHRPEQNSKVHASQVYLSPLERLAIFDADPVPRLQVGHPESLRRSLSPIGSRHVEKNGDGLEARPTLAVHPGSGSEKKNWPEERWRELLQRLAGETDFNFLIVGGEVEGEKLTRLARLLPEHRKQVAQSLPLAELAVALSACTSFVGHDSGIGHLAAAVGLPGLILWGDTPEEIWRPLGERMKLIRHPNGLASLGVAEVIQALNCAPPALKSRA